MADAPQVTDGVNVSGGEVPSATAYKRFRITPEEELFKWSLPEGMAGYVQENFMSFIPDKDVKDAVLYPNPRPDNLVTPKKIDDFLTDLLKEKRKASELALDATLEKAQSKTLDVMGPLSRLWLAVDKVNSHEEGEGVAPPQLSVQEAQQLIEQSILVLGQAFNYLLYERRKNVLGCVMSTNVVSSTLKDKAGDLAKDGPLLFGNDFRDHVVDTSKAKRKSMEAFTTSSPAKKPFREGPSQGSKQAFRTPSAGYSSSHNHYGGPSNRQRNRGRGPSYNQNRRGTTKGKILFTGKPTLLQHQGISATNELGEINSSSRNYTSNVLPSKYPRCAFSRKVKIFSPGLGDSHKGSADAVHSERFSNPFFVKTVSAKNAFPSEYKSGGAVFNKNGDTGNVAKGCYFQSSKYIRGVSKQCFSGTKVGWKVSSGNKFKGSESVYSIRALQDGRFTLSKGYTTTKRLYVQNRLEGCIFQHTFSPEIAKIYSVFMGRRALRVPMLVFWSWSCTKNFHKTIEGSNSHSAKSGDQNYYILRRHVDFGVLAGRSDSVKGHSDFPTSASGFCIKPEKVCLRTIPGDSFSGPTGKFDFYDFVVNSREVIKGKDQVCNNVERRLHDYPGPDKVSRSLIINVPGSDAGTFTTSLSSKPSNSGIKKGLFISAESPDNGVGSERADLVGRKPSTTEWPYAFTNSKPDTFANRCFNEGLGSILSGSSNRGLLDNRREISSHQCLGIASNKVRNPFNSQFEKGSILSHSGRQQGGAIVPVKNGGNCIDENDTYFETDLEYSISTRDHDYCRIPPRFSEHRGRLPVPAYQGLLGVETKTTGFQKIVQDSGNPNHRFVCIEDLKPGPELLLLEAGSILSRGGCDATGVASQSNTIRFPAVLSNRSDFEESGARGDNDPYSNNTNLAVTSMVSTATTHVKTKSNSTDSGGGSINGDIRDISPIVREQNTNPGGMGGFRDTLLSRGVSERAANLITASRRESTNATYSSAWNKWASWCSEKQADPFRCNINVVLDYLASLFEKGYEYSTVCFHRSAISAFHEKIDGKSVGEHPDVSLLVTGVFNKRPPQPRYNFIWDVQKVIDYIKSNLTENC